MRIQDIVIRSGRSIRQAKARTILTSLAIAVGAFTITLSLAAGAGGRSYTNQIVKSNTDAKELSVTKTQPKSQQGPQKYSANTSTSTITNALGTTVVLNENDINRIAKVTNVVSVSPNYSPQIEYITRPGQDKYVASISTFSPSVTLTYAAGSTNGDISNSDIILTEEYVSALGFKNDQGAIGKTVEIATDKLSALPSTPVTKTFTYTVKAISSKSGLAFRDQSSLLISNSSAKTLYDFINSGTRNYNNFIVASVRVNNASNAESVKSTLNGMGYTAQTSADILGVINTFINVLQGILLGFGALAILTSIFGIINTQYISVLERTQQIGLMKALGMRKRDVGRLFKIEAAWIGFLGGAIGSGLAFIAGTLANPLISKALNIGSIRLLIFSPVSISIVVVGLVLVSVASGILPARKAAKLNPIDALRTE
ncbi:MAG TPA: ABC transporter permease [Candidatus Saccharimonadales bacterium]|nr:ABC transporter permease [Candidatus Saccharimonadales bacterium]